MTTGRRVPDRAGRLAALIALAWSPACGQSQPADTSAQNPSEQRAVAGGEDEAEAASASGDKPTDKPAEQAAAAESDAGSAQDAQTSASDEAPLPASLKGYELYAWNEGAELRFTLTTGTNRQKTLAEIKTPPPPAEGSEFVAITGTGADQLAKLIARVPTGSPVVFGQHPELPALSSASRATVDAVIAR
jgi:hypothetical protein